MDNERISYNLLEWEEIWSPDWTPSFIVGRNYVYLGVEGIERFIQYYKKNHEDKKLKRLTESLSKE